MVRLVYCQSFLDLKRICLPRSFEEEAEPRDLFSYKFFCGGGGGVGGGEKFVLCVCVCLAYSYIIMINIHFYFLFICHPLSNIFKIGRGGGYIPSLPPPQYAPGEGGDKILC